MTLTAEPARVVRTLGEHLGARTHLTPVRLRLVAVGLLVLTVLMGVVGLLAASGRHAATSAASQTAEPLIVTAQAIDTSLSDADTSAAGSFLQPQLGPASVISSRYTTDLAEASVRVAAAAQEAGSDPRVTPSITTLSVDIPVYNGLVETATTNERQAYYPLAAAYLGDASNLMRSQILRAATQLYDVEGKRLAGDAHNATNPWPVVTAALLFIAVLASLIVVQRWLSNHFRRTLNVFLALATAIVVVLGIWFAVAIVAQSSDIHTASANGSGPVATYTQARIRALELRADDELTLLTNDAVNANQKQNVSPYQLDYSAAAADLQRLLGSARRAAGPVEQAQLAQGAAAIDAYRTTHDRIRQLDTQNHLLEAVALATGNGTTDLPAVSSHLDNVLAQAIVGSRGTFTDSMSGATGDLGGLIWAVAVLSLLAAALMLIGVRPRIAEYR